jgi:hypothetical protein
MRTCRTFLTTQYFLSIDAHSLYSWVEVFEKNNIYSGSECRHWARMEVAGQENASTLGPTKRISKYGESRLIFNERFYFLILSSRVDILDARRKWLKTRKSMDYNAGHQRIARRERRILIQYTYIIRVTHRRT